MAGTQKRHANHASFQNNDGNFRCNLAAPMLGGLNPYWKTAPPLL